ncbi:B12-binding domain-containing radical SAM protein [Clostridium tetani]|uniref:B12-binding domain-containing radical SAM protein n=1 Tax=Clostridium tetani TaxID=1513 RepID=A0A4Q0VEE0_CLOTA|nr:B12-binding domain-containing radical SAM protein [Clostridium tetani]RXI50588.1 B12-binding domain-containing radical SAM protein [Clostridium tetani]BDR63888.1 B12-binding domain-containing radical SAM protein [Clostridium tetani]BDR66606.1 B12-binding domain-containing radical SAM protein [Clostridium tetani]BDR72096.1 B12-binding domain-containing radical SAM protein [Clostridium tetani]
MKVILVAINSKFIHSNLAVRYLKRFTEDLQYTCGIEEFSINDRVERIVEEIILKEPEVVAFSCYIWNISYIKKVSRLIKLINPNIKIILGGPEVSFDARDYLKEEYCDFLIEGEGEETYRELIAYLLEKNKEKEHINNIKALYYIEDNEIIYTGKRDLMDMNDIVFPYEELEELNNKIIYYEASRGCPFNCKYCLSSTVHGLRFLNIDRVKKELQFFIDKKVKLVKFVDRTFNCDHEFAYEIWKFIIEKSPENITFHFEISADLLTEKEINLLSKAKEGLIQFEVGVQSTNKEVLKNINRDADFLEIKEKVEELLKIKNINQHLDLIAGLPGEDYNSFKNSFNDLYSIEPNEIQLGFLKLLKGSSMREEADKWGMIYSPYTPYEILKTNNISYEEILKLKRVEEVLDKYYNSGQFNNILKYFIKKFQTPFEFYEKLSEYFYSKGYFSRSISSVSYYKAFLDFSEEILKEKSYILEEIIKYDYLKFNKKKWLPEFLERHMDKKEERQIKMILKEQAIVDKSENINNYHIEKFKIDVLKYEEISTLEKGWFFILFDDNNRKSVKNITTIVKRYIIEYN